MGSQPDYNSAVRKGTELAGNLRSGTLTVGNSATRITTDDVPCLWIIFQSAIANTTTGIFVGSSQIASSGANRGINLTQGGETQKIDIDNLNKAYLISDAASQEVHYLAGLP